MRLGERREERSREHCPRRTAEQKADVWEGRFVTPWGEGKVRGSGRALLGISLPFAQGAPFESGPAMQEMGKGGSGEPLERWIQMLEDYLATGRPGWGAAEIGVARIAGSPFQLEVYLALLDTAPGETISYGRLAERAGHPRAARAVGTAMAMNPVPLAVPCHRVVRGCGDLGNFGAGEGWKHHLLRIEGAI